jgi:hypothetical protein
VQRGSFALGSTEAQILSPWTREHGRKDSSTPSFLILQPQESGSLLDLFHYLLPALFLFPCSSGKDRVALGIHLPVCRTTVPAEFDGLHPTGIGQYPHDDLPLIVVQGPVSAAYVTISNYFKAMGQNVSGNPSCWINVAIGGDDLGIKASRVR